MFDISWTHFIPIHDWSRILWNNLLRSLPFYHRHVHCILWWLSRIFIKRSIVCWEFRVTKQCIVISTNLFYLLYFILNWVFFRFLFFHLLLILTHIFLTVLIHFTTVVLLLLLEHHFVLFLTDWHSIFSDGIILVILSIHHLLLLSK